MHPLVEAFDDTRFKKMVSEKLPRLFYEANIRAKQYGTPFIVANFRKQIIKELLLEYFGKNRVEFIPQMKMPGIDVIIDSNFISIKTVTNNNPVKVIWGSDRKKMNKKMEDFSPQCCILLARINWEMKDNYQPSGLFLISQLTQEKIFEKMGIQMYLNPPREGTNSRGVPLSQVALMALLHDEGTKIINVDWGKI